MFKFREQYTFIFNDALSQLISYHAQIREKFSPRNQQAVNSDQVVGSNDVPIILRGKSSNMGDKSTIETKGDQETTATRDFQTVLKEENTLHSTGDESQESIQSSALSQQEGTLEISNISCERATDSSNLENETEDLMNEEFEHANLNAVVCCDGVRTSDGSQGKIEWQCQGSAVNPRLNKSYPETTEIQELLRRYCTNNYRIVFLFFIFLFK